MSFYRWLWIVAAGAVAVGGCDKGGDEPGGAPAGSLPKTAPEVTAARVEVAVLEASSASEEIVRPGEVQGAREAVLASALGGYVERVLVRSGDAVDNRQVIARVDTGTHRAQLQVTNVELDEAKDELARLEKLGKAIPRARVDAARARVARAKAQRQVALTRLSRATIRAPFAGTLVDMDVEPGEVLAPGAPIGRLIVLDPVKISVSVTDRDVGSLKEGGAAVVTTSGSPDPRPGSVARIEPAADPRTRTFLVDVEVKNTDHALLPGMIAQVAFHRPHVDDATMIPQDLLVTKLDENGVFVVDSESIARWRPLELGEIVGSQVTVESGLRRGDKIVSVGHRGLAEGDSVIVARQGICCRDGRIVYQAQPTPAPTSPSKKPETSPKKAETSPEKKAEASPGEKH